LRVVAVEGVLLPDPRGTSRGRGAHLHLDQECLALAERRRAFPRALRLAGPLDEAPLRAYFEQHYLDQHYLDQHYLDQQSGTTP
jgi:uncharacterized protein